MALHFNEFQKKLRENGINSPTKVEEQRWLSQMVRTAAGKFRTLNVLETGTLCGGTALVMAASVDFAREEWPEKNIQTKIVSVDSYINYDRNPDKVNNFEQNVAQAQEFGFEDTLTFVKADSIEYIKSLPDNSLSAAYLDSCHMYKWVKGELDALLPKMCKNSLICGHDYVFGVNEEVYAVDDFLRENAEYTSRLATHLRIWWFLVRHPIGTA